MKRIVCVAAASLALAGCGDSVYQEPGNELALGAAEPVVFADVELETGVQYQWSARAISSLGVGEWSDPIEFSVHETEADALSEAIVNDYDREFSTQLYSDELLVPTVTSRSPAGPVTELKPTFKWDVVDDVVTYEVRVSPQGSEEPIYTESFEADDICGVDGCELPSSDDVEETDELALGEALPTSSTDNSSTDTPEIANETDGFVAPEENVDEQEQESETEEEQITEEEQESETEEEQESEVNNSIAVNSEIEALQQSEGVLAFPGATGYGKYAQGGRGGRIITVNTLENIVDSNDNFMSLREAIQVESGPRTIVFALGGIFDAGDEEIIMNGENDSFVTVACQTAPSPGVIIRTYGFSIQNGVHDVIFRHCAVRNIDRGGNYGQSGRSFTVRSGSDDIIFDHMSLAWATDENFQVYMGSNQSVGTNNVTLSNSIVAEGDADSSHYLSAQSPQWSYHAMGPSCNNSNGNPSATLTNCSIVNNFIAHNSSRNAMIWGGTGELSNNVIYNWYGIGLTVQPHDGSGVSAIINNNLMKAGPSTSGATKTGCGTEIGITCALFLGQSNSHGDSRFSLGDNYFIQKDGSISDATLIDHPQANSPEGTPTYDAGTPSPVSVLNMAAQGSDFFDCVGSTRPLRDHVDTRVIQEFHAGTGRIGIGENVRNGGHNVTIQRTWSQFGDTAYHPGGYDSDGDGMPDEWESAYGTDPFNYNDHNGDLDGDGYTNVEEYLAIAGHC